MFICQLARRNLSDERDGVLPWWTHAFVKFHFTVCPPCRRFKASFERTMGALAAMRDTPPAQ
jgi:predicted anti-sigma-YlaC factor YlaD